MVKGGFKRHEVFLGNLNDSKTLIDISKGLGAYSKFEDKNVIV